ncbi:MAG: hypothetical protein HY246_05675 [Proteobacteria bacterium]|nr:hypothetical protein [Pseudomonadota bacterium]
MPTYPREVDDLPYEAWLSLCLRLLDVQPRLIRLQWAMRGRALGKYRPDQPRVPAGRPDGGQFTFDDDPLGIGTIDGLVDDGDDAESTDAGERILLASTDPFPPPYRANPQTLSQQIWDEFNDAVAKLPTITPTEQFIFSEIFAAEGGLGIDPNSRASSGITRGTLRRAQADRTVPGISGVSEPGSLTAVQRATVYAWFFDKDIMKNVTGRGARLNDTGDQYSAAAFADALFQHGQSKGGELVRQTINEIIGSLPPEVAAQHGLRPITEAGVVRDDAVDTFEKLVRAGYGDRFRDDLADKRLEHLLEREQDKAKKAEEEARLHGEPIPTIIPAVKQGDRDRVDHFRFRGAVAPIIK